MIPSLTTIELAGLILATEFALVACAVPAWLPRSTRRQHTLEADGARRLLDDVERAEPNRREALETIFADAYKLDADELGARVDEFIAREQAFYQVMTSVYLERDSRRLEEIPAELTKVIAPWIRLTPNNLIDAGALDTLEAENTALCAELDQTREHMEDLMREYLKAFDKQAAMAATAARVAITAAEGTLDEDRAAQCSSGRDVAPANASGVMRQADHEGDGVQAYAVDPEDVAADGDIDSESRTALADEHGAHFIDVSSDDAFDLVPLLDEDDAAPDPDDADALAGLFDEEIAALGAFDEEDAAAA
jgi:hypothetical protein